MKKFFIVVVFILITVMSFSQSITDMNGEDWLSLNESQKTFMVAGAMMSSAMNFRIAQSLNEFGDLSAEGSEVLANLNDMSVQVEYVVESVNRWYNDTREWDTEIYYVIFGSIGNLSKFVEMLDEVENKEKSLNEL